MQNFSLTKHDKTGSKRTITAEESKAKARGVSEGLGTQQMSSSSAAYTADDLSAPPPTRTDHWPLPAEDDVLAKGHHISFPAADVA